MAIKQKELESFESVRAEAVEMWKNLSKEHYDRDGDQGSCVLGDGIMVKVRPFRARSDKWVMYIPSMEVAFCQGSLHYERSVKYVLEFLRSKGLEVDYNFGRMD
jgi:hypothetical protein